MNKSIRLKSPLLAGSLFLLALGGCTQMPLVSNTGDQARLIEANAPTVKALPASGAAVVEGRSFVIGSTNPSVTGTIIANVMAPFLDRTSWRLVRLGDSSVTSLGTGQEPWLFLDEGRVSGFSGCNQFNGTYRTKTGSLVFVRIMGSTHVCVPVREQEKRVFQSLQRTRQWLVDEREPFHLQLLDQNGVVLAEFEPVKGNPLR